MKIQNNINNHIYLAHSSNTSNIQSAQRLQLIIQNKNNKKLFLLAYRQLLGFRAAKKNIIRQDLKDVNL